MALALSACGDVVEERYGNWQEAKQAGAVKRGWVPLLVPTTAQDLRTAHDLDSRYQRLTFTLEPNAVQPMLDDISPLAHVEEDVLRRAMTEVGWSRRPGKIVAAYMMCTRRFSAVIVAEPETGNVAYLSPAEWGRANCPRSL